MGRVNPVLVFVDVDGCINAEQSAGYSYMEIGPYPIYYRPAVVVWLRTLAAAPRVELMWASTWVMPGRDDHLVDLEAALGFEAAVPRYVHGGPYAWQRDWWKVRTVRAVLAQHPGRPWVWLDDDLTPDISEWLEEAHEPGLALHIAGHSGITDDDIARVSAFVERHTHHRAGA